MLRLLNAISLCLAATLAGPLAASQVCNALLEAARRAGVYNAQDLAAFEAHVVKVDRDWTVRSIWDAMYYRIYGQPAAQLTGYGTSASSGIQPGVFFNRITGTMLLIRR